MVQINMAAREITAEGRLLRARALRQDDEPPAAPRAARPGVARQDGHARHHRRPHALLRLPADRVRHGRSGFSVKLKLFTVPGQVMHKSTRKVVLAGADAVAFVADSQRASASANAYSWRDMEANLQVERHRLRRDPEGRAVQQARPARRQAARRRSATPGATSRPSRPSRSGARACSRPSASCCGELYRHLDAKHEFGEKFGVSEEDFLKGVFRNFARSAAKAVAGYSRRAIRARVVDTPSQPSDSVRPPTPVVSIRRNAPAANRQPRGPYGRRSQRMPKRSRSSAEALAASPPT